MAADYPIHPTSIKISTDLLRFVDERCKRQGCTRSFFISDVLRKYQEWLAEHEKPAGRGKIRKAGK